MLFTLAVWFFVALSLAIGLWFLLSLLVYRLSHRAREQSIQGKLVYKLVELSFSNRQFFEELMGNKLVRIEGCEALYISKQDYQKLWPESPFKMMEKGYTIEACLRVAPLVFGRGYAKAALISATQISAEPNIKK